jgi:hypothetical protein
MPNGAPQPRTPAIRPTAPAKSTVTLEMTATGMRFDSEADAEQWLLENDYANTAFRNTYAAKNGEHVALSKASRPGGVACWDLNRVKKIKVDEPKKEATPKAVPENIPLETPNGVYQLSTKNLPTGKAADFVKALLRRIPRDYAISSAQVHDVSEVCGLGAQANSIKTMVHALAQSGAIKKKKSATSRRTYFYGSQ